MPCSEKLKHVKDKWERREKREREEAERRQREAIPLPADWPKVTKPAEIPSAN